MALPGLRKHLSAPGLLKGVRKSFEGIPEHRKGRGQISLTDALMSGLAVFGLKYPSLLKFDEARKEEVVRSNLKTLYGVEQAPCDTQLRTLLDPVNPSDLLPAFREVHRSLQRGKALEAYKYLEGHYLLSIDGTGQFASSRINCPECCVKQASNGETQYYHQLLGAVLVHPEIKTVLPLMVEAIKRADGDTKNDCERNAAKRLLEEIRRAYPKLKLIVIQDSLAATGPHIERLKALDMRYILMVKEGDHEALFEQVQEKLQAGECEEIDGRDAQGVEYGYRFVNDLGLNKSRPDIRVNFLEYWEIKDNRQSLFCWVTDIVLTRNNLEQVMRGGRARWKIENETFNTLKNQGYRLEHNYGHGRQHLSTVLAFLMMLAFLIDQSQELSCRLFQGARQKFRSRTSLWEKLRNLFSSYYIRDWKTLWGAIITGHKPSDLQPQAP